MTVRFEKKPVPATPPRSITDQLDRIEDLLVEVRGVLDMHFKRISRLQAQLDLLSEKSTKK